jgi:phosphatidylserine/phosphatidylglycerophosphate/cardiolipin synthase-like enzyme
MRAGPEAVLALKGITVLPGSHAAAEQALQLVKAGEGPYTSGALTARLDVVAERAEVTTVWTGPDSHKPGYRLTVAVLADLISEAQSEILLVSYAIFPDADVRAALSAAAANGVRVTTLFERQVDNPHYESHVDPFPGLEARRLCWPADMRPPGASMHAKILVIDRHTALVGSANLTGFGLEKNLECGLLVRGGPIPREIADHILGLTALLETP